jgi:phage gpG-like protein
MISIDKKALKESIDKAKKDFQRFAVEAEDAVAKAVLKGALKVEGDAKKSFKGRDDASVPDEPPRVQTGRLRASITHRMISQTEAEVGTNVEYGVWLELGTSRTRKHPFLQPALETNRELVKQWI